MKKVKLKKVKVFPVLNKETLDKLLLIQLNLEQKQLNDLFHTVSNIELNNTHQSFLFFQKQLSGGFKKK